VCIWICDDMSMGIAFAVFGYVVGSLLGVLLWSLRTGAQLRASAWCPRCQSRIRWYDAIPGIGFLWHHGRCRMCQAVIPWQSPTLPLLAATGFAILTLMSPMGDLPIAAYAVNPHLLLWLGELGFWLVLYSVLLAVFVDDLAFMEIALEFVWVGLGMALLTDVFLDWSAWQESGQWVWMDSHIGWGLLSGGGVFLIFSALARGSGERLMGRGDAWLGLLLGWVLEWPGTLWMIALASGIGSLFGLSLLIRRRGTLRMALPFAPFLILGFWGFILGRYFFTGEFFQW